MLAMACITWIKTSRLLLEIITLNKLGLYWLVLSPVPFHAFTGRGGGDKEGAQDEHLYSF